jgi:hypothetical protein
MGPEGYGVSVTKGNVVGSTTSPKGSQLILQTSHALALVEKNNRRDAWRVGMVLGKPQQCKQLLAEQLFDLL